MSVIRMPEEGEPERDRILARSERIRSTDRTKEPAQVICFACRKEIIAGENHYHPYSKKESPAASLSTTW